MLVSCTEEGMAELRDKFEKYVLAQGETSVERCHETTQNVSHYIKPLGSSNLAI